MRVLYHPTRMRTATSVLVTSLAILLAACSADIELGAAGDDGGLSEPDLAVAAPPDLAESPDLLSPCAGKAACDCLNTPGCAAVESGCYCPPRACGQNACQCMGGFYYGCAPAAAQCPKVDCGPAGASIGPDKNGCYTCGPPPTCAIGRLNLKEQCNFSETWLTDLTCNKNPDCVLRCMAQLKSCEDVGCGFCPKCDCMGRSAFAQCVFACM